MSPGAVLILGATSDIGIAVARRFARDGHPIQLAGRRLADLAVDKKDIETRYQVPVTLYKFDALDTISHTDFVSRLQPLPDIAVCAVGLLGRQKESEKDINAAILVMRSNYEGPVSIMGALANCFEKRGAGTLIGISSVAGDIGRATNYVYGSAKAGFTTWLSGLRNRLASKAVHVITVKPGFVRTRMIEHKSTPAILTSTPEHMASVIVRAARKKRHIVYSQPIWMMIMAILRLLPPVITKRLRL